MAAVAMTDLRRAPTMLLDFGCGSSNVSVAIVAKVAPPSKGEATCRVRGTGTPLSGWSYVCKWHPREQLSKAARAFVPPASVGKARPRRDSIVTLLLRPPNRCRDLTTSFS
jgi:hypothetical protein